MFTGGKIKTVEARRLKEGEVKGFNVNINIEGLRFKEDSDEELEIDYTYTVDYKDEVGKLTISGVIFGKEDKKEAEKVVKLWKEDKRIPQDYSEKLLNAINYTATINAVYLSRLVNLAPPFIPPRLSMSKPNTQG